MVRSRLADSGASTITQVGVHFCSYPGVGKGRHCEVRTGNKAVHSSVLLPHLLLWQRPLIHNTFMVLDPESSHECGAADARLGLAQRLRA
jgi:hypothetical protein